LNKRLLPTLKKTEDGFVEPEPTKKKKKGPAETKKSEAKEEEKEIDVISARLSEILSKPLKEAPKIKKADAVKEEVKEKEVPKIEYSEIDLKKVGKVDDLVGFGGDHLKSELNRLGLKCGGSVQDRAQRLYDIKLNPSLFLNPKYLAKK